ncbi:MAG TPA: ZIP family metal transporter, partial [Hyphomonadaceae bacterium]|nr:ZIP family metal transporter [Hyphomonadaceae bacterium]
SGSEAAIVFSAAALSIAGVAFAMLAASMARRVTDIVGMAGGIVILAVAVFHLAPEAFASSGAERIFLFVGAGAGILLEVIFRTRSDPAPQTIRAGAWLGVAVLALHSMLDGAVYNAVIGHEDGYGMLASLGLITHEAPEGVVAMMLALQAGLKPWKAAGVAVVASSLTTPLGWALGHAIGAENGAMQAMFAASAGLLLYVGWHLVASGWRALRARSDA